MFVYFFRINVFEVVGVNLVLIGVVLCEDSRLLVDWIRVIINNILVLLSYMVSRYFCSFIKKYKNLEKERF